MSKWDGSSTSVDAALEAVRCGYNTSEHDALLQHVIDMARRHVAFVEDRDCRACGGVGQRCYGSTSTWHGGIGGAAITEDVCDKCWGSGSSERPAVDLRKLKRRVVDAEVKLEVARKAFKALYMRYYRDGNVCAEIECEYVDLVAEQLFTKEELQEMHK